MNRDDGLMACGALLGLLLTGYVTHTAKEKKREKKYQQYRDDLRSEEVAKDKPSFLNLDISDKCSCGKKVKPYEQQRLVLSEDRTKWFRLCAYCINNP